MILNLGLPLSVCMGLAKIAKLTSIVLEGMDNFHDFWWGILGYIGWLTKTQIYVLPNQPTLHSASWGVCKGRVCLNLHNILLKNFNFLKKKIQQKKFVSQNYFCCSQNLPKHFLVLKISIFKPLFNVYRLFKNINFWVDPKFTF